MKNYHSNANRKENNRKGSIYTLCLLLFLLNACADKPDHIEFIQGNQSTLDLTQVTKKYRFDDLATDIQLTSLESNDSILMAGIDKVVAFKDEYFILDKKYASLKVFSKEGKYRRTIGRLGNGPGEFTSLKDFILVPEDSTVRLLCNDKKAILIYSMDGRYTAYQRTDLFASAFDKVGNLTYYYINQNKSDVSGNYNLLAFDSSRTIKKRFSPFSNSFIAEVAFSGFMIRNAEGLLYNAALSDTAFQITVNGIYPKYIFSFGTHAMPAKLRNSFNDFIQGGLKFSYMANNVVEAKDALSLSYYKQGKLLTAFYNKKNKEIDEISLNGEDVFSYLLSPPMALIGDDRFLSYISVDALMNLVADKTISLEAMKNSMPEMYQKTKNMNGSENPILVTFRLKQPTIAQK